MRRHILLLATLLAASTLLHAQREGSIWQSVFMGKSPVAVQAIEITSPSSATFTTTADSINLSGTFSAGLVEDFTWSNDATMESGTLTFDIETKQWTAATQASNIVFSDTVTRTTSTPLASHTPDVGKQWVALRSDNGRFAEARSLDYVQPDSNDTGGTAVIITEAVPDSAIAGENYDVYIDLAAGLWSIGSTANTAVLVSIVDVTAATEDYCFLELFNALQNPDARFVKVVNGTPTVLASGDFGPSHSQTWRVKMRGDVAEIYQGAALRMTAEDAACNQTTRPGIGYGAVYPGGTRVISTGARIDNIRIEDPDAATVGIPLAVGENIITIEACEAGGSPCVQDVIVVTRSGDDEEAPTGSVLTPTSGFEYSTDQSTITWTGHYADNVAVDTVVVSCATMGCSPASITATLAQGTWTAGPFTIPDGQSIFSFIITDTSTNTADLGDRTVTKSASADTTDPTGAILTINGVSNTTGSSTHSTATVSMGGTAADNVALRSSNPVTWSSNGCGSGNASATGNVPSTVWSIANIVLSGSGCTVNITVHDAAGRSAVVDSHTFTYEAPLTIQTPSSVTMVEEQAVTFCFSISGGTSPYTVSKLSGAYPTGVTLTNNCLTGTPAMGSAGTYAGHSYRVTDDDTDIANTGTFTITVGTGSLGGQNNDLFNDMCASQWIYRCIPFRSVAEETKWGCTQPGINGCGSGGSNLGGFGGSKSWEYNPAGDTDPERQDAMKMRLVTWTTTVSVLGANINDGSSCDAGSPAGPCYQIVTLTPSTSQMRDGSAIKIDNEIMQLLSPTHGQSALISGGTQIWVIRAAYGTTAAAHTAGTSIGRYVNKIQQQTNFPILTSTTSSDTYLIMTDVYYTDDFGRVGMTTATPCAGVYNIIANANKCMFTSGGWKAFQVRALGDKINWEWKLSTFIGQPSLNAATYDRTSTSQVSQMLLRHYSTLDGATTTYSGADYVRPMSNKNYVVPVSKWTRMVAKIEFNHDQNTTAFATVTTLNAGLTADVNDTSLVMVAPVTLLPKPIGDSGTGLDYHIFGALGVQAGRRIKVGTEIMKLVSCPNIGAKSYTTPYICTVQRAVDGSTLAAHSSGANVGLLWHYLSLGMMDEDTEITWLYENVPLTVKRDEEKGITAVYHWNLEFDDSSTDLVTHRWLHMNFADVIAYAKNIVMLKKSGTAGAGGGPLPMEWEQFMVKPTAGGN
jgi:hypothetical protein